MPILFYCSEQSFHFKNRKYIHQKLCSHWQNYRSSPNKYISRSRDEWTGWICGTIFTLYISKDMLDAAENKDVEDPEPDMDPKKDPET